MMHVLLAGVSTRAAAASAVAAGYEVTAIDAFGDLDHAAAHVHALRRDAGRPFSARAAARAARTVACDAVVYLANFENHPAAVAALAAGRALWGNAPEVLARVREPRIVARALNARGFRVPLVSRDGRATDTFLVKPLASGGGRRVRRWHPGRPVPRGCYLQEFVAGQPGSVVFVAARGRAVPLGVTRQLVGDAAFGAAGYQYCGNILAPGDDALLAGAEALASAVAAEFDLAGLNGIDFIDTADGPVPIEVNPRWTASIELVERARGVSAFAAHAAACARGDLPAAVDLAARRAVGKAVVFARAELVVGDTRAWLGDRSVADVPHPGERIRRRHPVCTVFAEAADAAACYAGLVRRAGAVHAAAARWAEAVA